MFPFKDSSMNEIDYNTIMFLFKDSPDDYEPVMEKLLQFNAGDIRVNHTVKIIDDVICESCPTEVFFCNISLLTVDPRINISQDHARVMIVDSKELECSK